MNKYFLILIIILAGCSEKKITGKELMPEMLDTDSLVIIYFKSPQETRYFTYVPVNNDELIKQLVNDATAEVTSENPCLKDGKIYCYRRGEIFNTIFFGYLDDECTILRYIKNGNLYHFSMSDRTKSFLQEYRGKAIEPSSP